MALKLDADIDFTRQPFIYYFIALFAVSRIPFVNLGFSAFVSPTDLDVLSVVNSAYLLRYYHIYTVSRFPGYPFFEILNSLLIGGGWLFTNIATSIASLLALILFGKILNIFNIKNKAILFITFAFIPIIWINSTITMDYMWALMFILIACFFVFTGKFPLAGFAIGVAVGTRFTSIFMIIPLIYWMLIKEIDKKSIRDFILIGASSSVLMFLPVFYKYHVQLFKGSGFFSTTPVSKSLDLIAESILLSSVNLMTELTGLIVFTLLIILLFYKKGFQSSKQNHLLNFCWIILIIYGIIYFMFPYKVAYLIPLIPWALIIFNEKLQKKYVVLICFLLLINNIISINISSDDSYKLNIDSGSLLRNYEARNNVGINQSKEYLESLSIALKEENDFIRK